MTEQTPDASAPAPPAAPADPNAHVYALLAAWARRAADGTLATAVALGLLALPAAVALPSPWWQLLLPLVIFGSLGAWGIADRVAAERTTAARTAALVKGIAIALGTAAAAVFGFGMLAMLLGTWIS